MTPPDETSEELASRIIARIEKGSDDSGAALEDFLDLCVADEKVQTVMTEYALGRDDLKEIYWLLVANGLGLWVKGHFAAASTIAYFEPLYFFVESQRRGLSIREIVSALHFYWEGRIP